MPKFCPHCAGQLAPEMIDERERLVCQECGFIFYISPKVDFIIGPLAIIMPNAMMGEVTPGMAEAVSSSEAKKILIPLTQERVDIVGITGEPLPHLVDQVVGIVKEMYKNV